MMSRAAPSLAFVLLIGLGGVLLAGDPPAPKVDALGDPLPVGAVARLGTARLRHAGAVLALWVAPDAKSIRSIGVDGTIRAWELPTGRERERIVMSSRLSRMVLAGARLRVEFSRDGRYVMAHAPGEFGGVWSTATGEESPLHAEFVHGFSPDGTLAAIGSASGRELSVVSLATGRVARRFGDAVVTSERPTLLTRESVGAGSPVAFSPDNRRLASIAQVGTRAIVGLFSLETGARIATFDLTAEHPTRVALAGDGGTLVTWGFGSVMVRDLATGRERRVRAGFSDPEVAFSADATTVVTGDDFGFDGGLRAIGLSADGKTCVTGDRRGLIRVVDGARRWEREPEPQAGSITDLLYAPDGKSILTMTEDSVRVWQLPPGRPPRPDRSAAWKPPLAISPDSRLLACGPKVRLFEYPTGRGGGRDLDLPLWTFAIAFSPDGRRVASGARVGSITVSDVESRSAVFTHEVGSDPVCLSFSSKGETLRVACRDGQVRVLDAATGALIHRIERRTPPVLHAAFSPDGKSVVSLAADGVLRFLDVADGSERRSLGSPADPVRAFALSPDGARYAVAIGPALTVHDEPTGRALARFDSPQVRMDSLAFSPDGRELASGGADATVLLWDVAPVASR
jgi:WD40 repeat protein